MSPNGGNTAQMEVITALILHDAASRVVVHPRSGMLVTSFVDRESGADAIWTSGEPLVAADDLGPSGAASIATFVDRFVGGWFPMIPTVGFPDDDSTDYLHGTAARRAWSVDNHTATSVRASVALGFGLRATRTLVLSAGSLVTRTRVSNDSTDDVAVSTGEHPCFDLALFSRLTCAPAAVAAPHPPLDSSLASLQTPQAVAWPLARDRAGAMLDISDIGRDDWVGQDHLALELPIGAFSLEAREPGLSLDVSWDSEVWPYALIWRSSRAEPGASVLAVEPASLPGRSAQEQPTAARLLPGGSIDSVVTLSWRRTAPIPTGGTR